MSTTCTPKGKSHRPHGSLRKANAAAQRQTRHQVDEIMSEGAAQEAAAEAAAAMTDGHLTEAEVLAWRQDLNQRIDVLLEHPEQNMGFVEEELARAGQKLTSSPSLLIQLSGTPIRFLQIS